MYLLLALLLVVVVVWLNARGGQPSDGSFQDYLINWKAFSRRMSSQNRRSKLLEKKLSGLEPEAVVEMLLEFPGFASPVDKAVRKLGESAVPALIHALSDPRFRVRDTDEADAFPWGSPMDSVLRILEEFAPPEAISGLMKLVDDEDSQIRRPATRLLAVIAADESIETLKQRLVDEDEGVRSAVTSGIIKAARSERPSARFRDEMFSILAERIFDESLREAPACLLGLDRERAVSVLTGPECLVLGNGNLAEILGALGKCDVRLDEERLLSLYAQCEGDSERRFIASRVLNLLARQASPRGLEVIERALQHDSHRVRRDAADAFATAHGLDRALDYAGALVARSGWEGLRGELKNVLVVRTMVELVRGDGFLGYFAGSEGDKWPEALEGLRAIGANETERLLRRAVDRVGLKPHHSYRQRRNLVAKIAATSRRPFEDIEPEFYKDHDLRRCLLAKYVLRHRDLFREQAL